MATSVIETGDRRRYVRLQFGIRIFEEKDWMLRDLSAGGCFVETSKPLPPGSEVNLRFPIPLEGQYVTIVASGLVRRRESGGMAIKFVDLEPLYSSILKEFVNTYK